VEFLDDLLSDFGALKAYKSNLLLGWLLAFDNSLLPWNRLLNMAGGDLAVALKKLFDVSDLCGFLLLGANREFLEVLNNDVVENFSHILSALGVVLMERNS
jgi:hypothetical protein